jgi:hypothetical protein
MACIIIDLKVLRHCALRENMTTGIIIPHHPSDGSIGCNRYEYIRCKMNRMEKIELEIKSLKRRLKKSLESKEKIASEVMALADAMDKLLNAYDDYLINEAGIPKKK